MAGLVTIRVEGSEAIREVMTLAPDQIPIAIRDAVNKTIDWVNTRTVGAITSAITVKRSDITGNAHRFGGVTKTKATTDRPIGSVSVTGGRIPVYRFGSRPTAPPTKRGISYQISRSSGRKRINQNAFVAMLASGHAGDFTRVGPKVRTRRGRIEQRIAEMFGPSIPEVAERSPELKQALEVDATEKLEQYLANQVDRFIAKGKA